MLTADPGFEPISAVALRYATGEWIAWVQVAEAHRTAYHVSVHEIARLDAECRRKDATIARQREELRTLRDELARYTRAQIGVSR